MSSFIFADAYVFLNYISTSWRLTTDKQKWIVCVFIVTKRFVLQHWKDKYPPLIQGFKNLVILWTHESIKVPMTKILEIWDTSIEAGYQNPIA